MAAEIPKKNSVNVENVLSHDLLTILSNHGDKMTLFMKLFWQQQQRDSGRKPTGRRYHPTIIRWCLSISSKSASAYGEFRDTFIGSNIIELPSRRELRDYSNAVTPQTGFNRKGIKELTNTTKDYNPFQKYDEMKIQGGLM